MVSDSWYTYLGQLHTLIWAIVQAELKLQPIALFSTQFPPKYLTKDHLAVKNVNAAIKKQMKHVRYKLRNILLTGIVAGSEPELPRIPNLVELSRLLWRHLNDGNSGIADSEINMKVGPHLRIRFCYLRLATASNYFNADSRNCNVSQWDQIDTQLNANRSEIVRYTNW